MPDEHEFARSTEPFRRELLAHCYRMLGSLDEAEDLVQETYLRAWRSYGTFEGRSSLRVWLYRIATNACLTALRNRSRRALPSGLGPPADDPDISPDYGTSLGVAWVQPIPDALVATQQDDPATVVATRESVRLALIAGLQYLPPRQRAVLLLREVLGFPASEVAAMLDTSVAAVKSALQRARARLDEAAVGGERLTEPTAPHARALLEQYIAGFQNADVQALERALRTDASIEMVGTRTWFSGIATCLRYLTQVVGSSGDWRMAPTLANGHPAAAAYLRGVDGIHHAFGLGVLTTTRKGIARVTVFSGGPELLARFGLPPTWEPPLAKRPAPEQKSPRLGVRG
ncbi:sigma-70 family RNA polymerase sigma factor [Actinomadura graeca]|uniref:Sigma-70 family RNA polymerase sigma factor n=1 Tax=Actinomadura graeca TaxID=2750812 RepID=A0ABX8QSN9_9ACTN|nr:sigma-70 family RNA polymerase sigma factor [Actinomadura graeca]QXJ20767.1 sigma-70 family RNA polymerase sigma factor [Actinomadura graeca]